MVKNLTLTPQQSEAVQFSGDSGIIAAPGSGKTFVLVEKLAYLVSQKKIPPDQVLVVTFSEKAASEIRGRVFKRLGLSGKPAPMIGTLHATLASFLGHPQILEEPLASLQKLRTTRDLLTQKLKENDPETTSFVDHFGYYYSIRLAATLLSKRIQKNHPYSNVIAAAREAYKGSLDSTLDFDDLERSGHELLSQTEAQKKIQKQFQWIFVDEFQDTSPIQWEIIQRLHAPGQNHLAIVGDPRQSIYRFRGARPHIFWEAMKQIEKSGGKLFHLDENFRSAPKIIDFVNRLAPSLFPDFPRPMIASRPSRSSTEVDRIRFEKGPLETQRTQEAEKIAAQIKQLHREGTDWTQIALLFRTRRAMPYFEKAFQREEIPFISASGESLLEQPEVIRILFYFKKILKPEDPLATLALSYGNTKNFSFPVAQAFQDFVLKLLEMDPSMTLETLLDTIHDLRSEEARIPCPDSSGEKDGVRLMTVHGAKGLEFPIVILCDLSARPSSWRPPYLEHPEQGVLFKDKEEIPGGLKGKLKKSDLFEELENRESQAEDEESRRLLYVAMTRAKDKLILPLVDSKKSKGSLKTWNEMLSVLD